jgi:hypothetical protein
VLEQVLDQHPELRSPITEVVLPQDQAALELQAAHQRVADDRAAQVPDVHLLGDVGLRVVDDRDGARRRRRDAQPPVGAPRRDLAQDRAVGDGEVEEPGPGHLDLRDQVVGRQRPGDPLRHLARPRAQPLGQR